MSLDFRKELIKSTTKRLTTTIIDEVAKEAGFLGNTDMTPEEIEKVVVATLHSVVFELVVQTTCIQSKMAFKNDLEVSKDFTKNSIEMMMKYVGNMR